VANSISYCYDWLAACASSPNECHTIAEAGYRQLAIALRKPVVCKSIEMLIGSVVGQFVVLILMDLAVSQWHQHQVRQACGSERVLILVSVRQAINTSNVCTATQQKTIKLTRQ
jgi:hypothetical protein